MKINQITLCNFGSYEGENVFETQIHDDKNIIIIGGKNGAGKTTLFTAIRLCLYGYMSMGYRSINSYYTRSIVKLINNTAKLNKPTESSVTVEIFLSNGQELDFYKVIRIWTLTDSFSENFVVIKNGNKLDSDAIADFEKYIISLIPPELFNLYFFDGEKIADFFMEEGSNSRIKDAFLTICGYDTFDIMRKNFKRVSSSYEEKSSALAEYISAKEFESEEQAGYNETENKLAACKILISNCEADIISVDKNYLQSGGITQEEWNNKLDLVKEEEKKREQWNLCLKKWANEIIPFIMIRDKIIAVRDQIYSENDNLKYRHFAEVLCNKSIVTLLNEYSPDIIKRLDELASKLVKNESDLILDLSFEKSSELLSLVNELLAFDVENVLKYKKSIKRSIAVSANIRKELNKCNVNAVQEYLQKRAMLLEEKNKLLHEQVELEQNLITRKERLQVAKTKLEKCQLILEEGLKKASINDISARAIIVLDKLQGVLYKQQIKKMESCFRKEIKSLMRKTRFIDDISIDDDFNIRVYRNENITHSKLQEIFNNNNEFQLNTLIGEKAILCLKQNSGTNTMEGINNYLTKTSESQSNLPLEIDKTTFSNGEKQIFIMALYYSLVQLCSGEIPFIIDTPFARIDTEHRHNISKNFFSKLKGQVFIFSTNEEITSSHMRIMKDKILVTYMLENMDNKKTSIFKNTYFEVKNGI